MIRENDLLSFQNENLKFVRVKNLKIGNFLVDTDSECDFIKLLGEDTKYLFYEYLYYNKEDLIIDDEAIEKFKEYNKEIASNLDNINDDIECYNQNIESQDFEEPYELRMYAKSNDIGFSYNAENLWIDDAGICLDRNIALEILANQGFNDNFEIESEERKKERIKEVKLKLADFIYNDDRFALCTNSKLRSAYALKLAEDRSDLMLPFKSKCGHMYLGYLENFVEMVWKCKKNGELEIDKLIL